MDGVHLADRLAYGAGCAARHVGFVHDAYRANGPVSPIDLTKRIMRLTVAYVLPGGSVAAPSGVAVPYRQAWADWSYLCVGDYLVGPEGCTFVAAIEPPKPMLVIMTNATIEISRPAAPMLVGINPYSAALPKTQVNMLSGFPASLLVGGLGDRTRAGLPDDTRIPGIIALLPSVKDIQIKVGDLVTNNWLERYVVTAVEHLSGIWRLSLIQTVS